METLRCTLSNLKFFTTGGSRFVILSLGTGIASVGLAVWFYRCKTYIPSKWKKVGELSDLMCFPVKSCGVVRENEFDCSHLGLQKGTLRDRHFMLIDLDGQFITGRQQPNLVKVTPVISGTVLTLTAPGMMDHSLDFEYLNKKGTIKATIWGEKVSTVDCGEEVAKWFSRFLLSEDTGFRLVYFPFQTTTRDYRIKNRIFERIRKTDSGALQDSTNFNLIAESSVADLNSRLSEPVTPQHFRPNFVVKGTQMYEEDTWNFIKIGPNAVFQNVKPCIRYRQITDPAVRLYVGECPVMGVNLGLRIPGMVKLGDSVYIGE